MTTLAHFSESARIIMTYRVFSLANPEHRIPVSLQAMGSLFETRLISHPLTSQLVPPRATPHNHHPRGAQFHAPCALVL